MVTPQVDTEVTPQANTNVDAPIDTKAIDLADMKVTPPDDM